MFAFVGVTCKEPAGGNGAFKVTCVSDAATFPATSVALTSSALRPGLSETLQEKFPPLMVAAEPLQVTELSPDRESAAEPVTGNDEFESTLPSVGELTTSDGLALSRLMLTLVDALFPAASVTVPETTWPTPLVETICGPGQETTGELPAAQVKVTVVFKRLQPDAFAAGDKVAVTPGGTVPAVTLNGVMADMGPWVAVIVVVPIAVAVANPLELTVAMPLLKVLQVTEEVRFWVLPSLKTPVAVNCTVPPKLMPAIAGVTMREVSEAD